MWQHLSPSLVASHQPFPWMKLSIISQSTWTAMLLNKTPAYWCGGKIVCLSLWWSCWRWKRVTWLRNVIWFPALFGAYYQEYFHLRQTIHPSAVTEGRKPTQIFFLKGALCWFPALSGNVQVMLDEGLGISLCKGLKMLFDFSQRRPTRLVAALLHVIYSAGRNDVFSDWYPGI